MKDLNGVEFKEGQHIVYADGTGSWITLKKAIIAKVNPKTLDITTPIKDECDTGKDRVVKPEQRAMVVDSNSVKYIKESAK